MSIEVLLIEAGSESNPSLLCAVFLIFRADEPATFM